MASDDKVIIGLTTGLDGPERVLIGYLMGVEDAVHVATEGFAAKAVMPTCPARPTCTRSSSPRAVGCTRARSAFAEGGALTFNY